MRMPAKRARFTLFVPVALSFVWIFFSKASDLTAPSPKDSLCMPASRTEPVQPIDAYIHTAWDKLSRSMDDCRSVADPKLTTVSILYLPEDVPEPREITALRSSCKIKVERLPRRIE